MTTLEAYELGYEVCKKNLPMAPFYHFRNDLWHQGNVWDLCQEFGKGYAARFNEEFKNL